jgi:hypothetical protein
VVATVDEERVRVRALIAASPNFNSQNNQKYTFYSLL